MENHQKSDRLSWGDSVFLNLERDGMPLNVGSVSLLEGEIPFRSFLRFVESKLPLIPRYLKHLVAPPFNIGLPSWDYDPEFDLRNHVREVMLKNGTDRELKALAGKLFGKVMDRQHPLWDLTLVRGLKGNRSGLIVRMHHCLVDGIGGVGIVSALMDASAGTPRLPRRKFRVPPPREASTSLVEGLTGSYSDFINRILTAWSEALNMAEGTVASHGNLATEEFSRLLPELTASTERLRFNVIYRGPQKFAWAEIPLEEVKTIRHACGTSVNDVLLALVTATIRRYSEHHGDRVKGKLLRIMVPVNLRGNDGPADSGNHISLVPVTIPLDIRPPKKLLAAVHRRTEFLKRVHAAELVSLAGGLIGIFPSPMQAFAGPMISQVPFTPFNMVCTSVPGPQFPLYLLGHKMLHWYPYVPVGGELAVNCAILSYNGMVYFGFSGDVHAAPDLGRLEKFVRESFAELRDAARVTAPRKKAEQKKPARTKKQVAKPAVPRATTVRVAIPLPVVRSSSESTEAPEPTALRERVLAQSVA
jgi:diacylglycerol O-acyltransferase / wax synthase